MSRHAFAPLATALLAAAACTTQFEGPEKVTGLRVLGVRAEPPEIGAPSDASGTGWPADRATVETLVGLPAFANDAEDHAVVLHLGCTPAPGEVLGTVCTQMSALENPSDLLPFLRPENACTDPGRGAVDGITFSGLEACSRSGCGPLSVLRDPADPASTVTFPSPTYALPQGFSLSGLPAGDPSRVLGADVIDLALALEAAPGDLAPATAAPDDCAALSAVLQRIEQEWPSRANITTLKWLHVRGPDMPAASSPNHNPSVAGIALGGAPLSGPGGVPLSVVAGQQEPLLPSLPAPFEDLRETYQRYDSNGLYLDTRAEEWAYSWFTTGGDLADAYTSSWDEENSFTPRSGRAVLWLVVRDLRGGMAWTAGEVEAP